MKTPARLNALCVSKLIRHMMDVPSTCQELSEACGLGMKSTRGFVAAMLKEGVIRIVDWEPDSLGRLSLPAYSFGPGTNKRRPGPRIDVQNRTRRERRALESQIEMQNALAGLK